VATLGNFAADMIRQLGGKPTPQAQKLFGSWQQWEGGHTANAATWNPLNLTAPGSGLPTINEVGVVALPSRQAGVQRTANLIESGYPALARAFRSGQVDFSDPDLQADLNRWLTGKRTPGMTPYVSKIARSYGANVPPSVPLGPAASPDSTVRGGVTPPTPAAPQVPVFDPQAYAESVRSAFMQGGGRMDLMQIPGLTQAAFHTPAAPGATPAHRTGSPSPASGAAPIGAVMPSNNLGARAVKQAARQLGDPYVFGASSAGADPSSFDCSSLVQWAYRQVGVDIPRDTYGQQAVLKPKAWKNLQIGDPIYRRSGGHVVIYAGGNRVIAAPHTGTVVKYQPLSDFAQDEYVPYQIPHRRRR
jgi:cell wall-associated NlpC family hydrolase